MNGWQIATTIYMSLMIISVVYGQGKPRPNMGFMVVCNSFNRVIGVVLHRFGIDSCADRKGIII